MSQVGRKNVGVPTTVRLPQAVLLDTQHISLVPGQSIAQG